jgi:hypothetical protein
LSRKNLVVQKEQEILSRTHVRRQMEKDPFLEEYQGYKKLQEWRRYKFWPRNIR